MSLGGPRPSVGSSVGPVQLVENVGPGDVFEVLSRAGIFVILDDEQPGRILVTEVTDRQSDTICAGHLIDVFVGVGDDTEARNKLRIRQGEERKSVVALDRCDKEPAILSVGRRRSKRPTNWSSMERS